MKPNVIIVGYTKKSYVDRIRSYFAEPINLICIYSRPPATPAKKVLLTLFDQIFNYTEPAAGQALQALSQHPTIITCTQERDIDLYIEVLAVFNQITEKQKTLYQKCTNKKLFKETLAATYPELVPGVTTITSSTDIERLSYPQVVKPTGLAGSSFVYVAKSAALLQQFLHDFQSQLVKSAADYYGRSVEIIAEEFIAGRQFSVNAYVDAAGAITVCPLTRVVPATDIGQADSYSALQYTTDELTHDEYQALETALEKIVETFLIRSNSAHFDSVLTDSGQWKFFEVGLRIGGKRQTIYDLSYGFDHFRNDIANKRGFKITFPMKKQDLCVVQKGAAETGQLQKISYSRTITTNNPPLIREYKLSKLGTLVKPVSIGGNTITRHIVTGKDSASVLRHSKQLFNDITFTIT